VITKGRFDLIEALYNLNVDLNILMPNLMPPIYYAVSQYVSQSLNNELHKKNLYLVIESLLLKIPHAIDVKFDDMSAVDIAAQYGDLAIIKLLIYHDSSIYAEDNSNRDHFSSALIYAASGCHLDVMFQLYLYGAHLPTSLERKNFPPLAVSFMEKLEEVEMLDIIDQLVEADKEELLDFDDILNGIETKVSQITDDASLDLFFADIPHYIPDYCNELHAVCLDNDFDILPDIEQKGVGRF
jgi:hypothetical protein